jgi:hypothetical protein
VHGLALRPASRMGRGVSLAAQIAGRGVEFCPRALLGRRRAPCPARVWHASARAALGAAPTAIVSPLSLGTLSLADLVGPARTPRWGG